MDNQGWVSLHRKIRYNPIYTNRKYLHVWIEILLSVNHKEKKFIWNNETITVEKGQGIFSQKKLSEELGIPIGTVHRCLKWLKTESMVETKTTSKFTLIKVLNWDMYQENGKENGKQNENRMKAGGKQNETNNNDNNINNENNNTKVLAKAEYGNKYINEIIKYLESKVGKLDGTVKSNRYQASNLIKKLKKEYPNKTEEEIVNGIRYIIDIGLNDDFHRKNLTGIGYLSRNFKKIYNTKLNNLVVKI